MGLLSRNREPARRFPDPWRWTQCGDASAPAAKLRRRRDQTKQDDEMIKMYDDEASGHPRGRSTR